MTLENEYIIVEYNECDKEYISDLIRVFLSRMSKIASFFNITFEDKIRIVLYDNLDKYKENLIESFQKEAELNKEEPRQYEAWMIANTEDGNINMLSLSIASKMEKNEGLTKAEFIYNASHEFVHLCQTKCGSDSPSWFWEVLATYLGNPECQHETTDIITIEGLYEDFDYIDNYGSAFKIANYLFNKYSKEDILSLIKENDKLKKVIIQDLEEINKPQKGLH